MLGLYFSTPQLTVQLGPLEVVQMQFTTMLRIVVLRLLAAGLKVGIELVSGNISVTEAVLTGNGSKLELQTHSRKQCHLRWGMMFVPKLAPFFSILLTVTIKVGAFAVPHMQTFSLVRKITKIGKNISSTPT